MERFKYICVYAGSSDEGSAPYKDKVIELGKSFARHELTLIYGGACIGLMGVLADSMVQEKGHVLGFTTQHIHAYEGGHQEISQLYVVESMHARKHAMFEKADAFVILPGGYGTLDEFFEMLTWKQIGLHTKPIIVLNLDGYWDPVKELLQYIRNEKFAKPETQKLCIFVNSVEGVFDALRTYHTP